MSSRRHGPLLLVVDLAAPAALFYGLRAAGTSDVVALLAGAVPALINAGVSIARDRRADLLGTAVVLGLLGSAAVALLGGDARVLLVRGAWVSLPFAGVVLWSLRHPQPLCYVVTRAALPRRAAAMDRLWEISPACRLAWRRITVLWGIVSIIDAVIRIVTAYTLPLDVVPAVDPVITVATVIVLQVPTHLLLLRSGTWRQVFAPRGPDPVLSRPLNGDVGASG
ncbi:hypothetical protein OG474_45100 [Kribbella sp. NBC_01505]|uniref:VC0807 family protein n=1 Tax=Kribbella sp. NBC_01505 TaxID=2903580 RepID=UPI003867FB9A